MCRTTQPSEVEERLGKVLMKIGVHETRQQRYRKELRPYLFNEERHDLTVRLWVEMIEEIRSQSQNSLRSHGLDLRGGG